MKKRYGNELHPCYKKWQDMVQRCENPNHVSYKNYGGRGIKIHPELRAWKDWISYVETLENYSSELSLDRLDNNVGYQKGNLRWVTMNVQIANQRFSGKGFNKYTGVNYSITHNRWVARVTFEGKTLMSKICYSEEEALKVRNQFILGNNLPHTIQTFTG